MSMNLAPMASVNKSKLHKDLSKQVAEVNRSYKMMKQYVLAGEYVMARNLAEQAQLDAFEVKGTMDQVISEILAFDQHAFSTGPRESFETSADRYIKGEKK